MLTSLLRAASRGAILALAACSGSSTPDPKQPVTGAPTLGTARP